MSHPHQYYYPNHNHNPNPYYQNQPQPQEHLIPNGIPINYDASQTPTPQYPPVTLPSVPRYSGHESHYSLASGNSGYEQSQGQPFSQYQPTIHSASQVASDISQFNSRSLNNTNLNGGSTNGGGGSTIRTNPSLQQPPTQPNSSTANVTSNTAATLTSVSTNATNGAQPIATANSTGGNSGVNYLSEIETAILRSSVPINLNETEEITVNGQRGIWANRSEVVNWRGVIPINEYSINEDSSPEIITKRADQTLTYIQELAVRYLRPPTPPAPGEIIITQEINSLTPPAPPLIIRQQPPRPSTPEPLVIREAPPPPPPQVGRKVITISGKRLPPPPRKVIIERLAPLPSKPQAVLIERWLPYSQVKRRVIYQRSNERDAVVVKPKNVIVQWEAPQVIIKKDFKYLGIIRANPVEYVQRYGSSLKTTRDLPDFVLDIKPPAGVVLAADYQYNQVHELEGDLQALRLVDLEREGLTEYRSQLQRLGINYVGPAGVQAEVNNALAAVSSQSNVHSSLAGAGGSQSNNTSAAGYYNHQQYPPPQYPQAYSPPHQSPPPVSYPIQYNNHNPNNATVNITNQQQYQYPNMPNMHNMANMSNIPPVCNYGNGYGAPPVYHHYRAQGIHHSSGIVSELFSQFDRDLNGRISIDEAEKLLLKLNSRLGRRYSEDDIRRFFLTLDTNRDGTIELQEFRAAFERVI